MNEKTNNSNSRMSLYFTKGMKSEVLAEAERLDRSVSWVLQKAWTLAREHIRKMEEQK